MGLMLSWGRGCLIVGGGRSGGGRGGRMGGVIEGVCCVVFGEGLELVALREGSMRMGMVH